MEFSICAEADFQNAYHFKNGQSMLAGQDRQISAGTICFSWGKTLQ